MLGKRSAIGKLAGAIRAGIMDPTTSPSNPLGFIIESPSKPNKSGASYDIGGIGLGIVVALDKPNNNNNGNNNTGGDHQCKVLARYAFHGPFPAHSGLMRATNRAQVGEKGGILGGLDEGSTIMAHVTCHGTGNKSIMASTDSVAVTKISPAKLSGDHRFSGPDFLSLCHLCKKALHGKDIYMYGGEKAFCSTECRQREIRMDERKEKFKSSEPCSYTTTNASTKGQIFFSTGVVAV